METVNPTRMDLLLKREEINTATTGAELLRNKRDVLLNEFFSTLKSLMLLRDSLDNQATQASRSLIFALGLEGREKLSSFSFNKYQPKGIEINYKNLWGIKIPQITVQTDNTKQQGDLLRIDTGTVIEETKEDFRDFLNLALKVLPQELKLKRLGQEIKNTSRKVNALEKYVIVQLQFQVKFIREALEEREREDIFRLKRLKKHLMK